MKRTATSSKVEMVDFLFCPKDRVVKVNVPVRLANADASVGVRKGAWLKTTM